MGRLIKKILKYCFMFFGIVIILLISLLYITDNQYILKAIPLVYFQGKTTASIDDYKNFDFNKISKGKSEPWAIHPKYNSIKASKEFINILKTNKTAEFVVIYQGKLLYETYFDPFNSSSKTNSFSMAKTITAFLAQKAVEDGFIKSLDEPIINYLPEYKSDSLAKFCTIRDLIKMTSGYDWEENYYYPINPTAKAYYGDNLDEVILTRPFKYLPNTKWQYLSGTSQLLGYVVRRAVKQPLANYLSEKFWKPLGMETDGVWTLDNKKGIEKTYCCIYSDAKNFAKFGQMMLNKGSWNNKQLIDSTYINKAITPNPLSDNHYGYSLWIDYNYKYPFYFFRGHLGQYIICIPSKDLVIVRLGEGKDVSPYKYSDKYYPNDIYEYINESLRFIQM